MCLILRNIYLNTLVGDLNFLYMNGFKFFEINFC